MKDQSFMSIARRYFVLNGFDGILTVLGITVGSFSANIQNPRYLITSGMGAIIALGISGLTSGYITEKAERLKKFKQLQDAMFSSLENSRQKENVEKQSFVISVVNGASPFLLGFLSIIPYFLSLFGLISITFAYLISVVVAICLLAFLGALLGHISRENILIYSLKTVGIGLLTLLVSSLLGIGA